MSEEPVTNDTKPLVVYPEFFEDLAIQLAGDLCNVGLVVTEDQFDQAIALTTKRLRFQHNLHLTWQEGDEDTIRRTRMDRP